MKKSYKRLIIFDLVLLIILLLNSFILNILGNYYYMDIFLILALIGFKLLFGFEKDRHRYIKDTIANMVIIFLVSFILYYIMGIFVGFYKTTNYWSFYGIMTFIVPYVLMIVLREFFRAQMLTKTDQSKLLSVFTFFMFLFVELSVSIGRLNLGSGRGMFMYFALTFLPILSNNIVCTYLARKVGCKPNIFWLLVAALYTVVLPIAPNAGIYITCLIEFLFPYVILYFCYRFFQKRDKDIPISYIKKRVYVEIYGLAVIVFILAYFVSGYFRYYAIAIATGSMRPNINVGDVVIVDQYKEYKDLKIGDVIAYRYNGIVVVHRLYDMIVIRKDYYFYSKGDANDAVDNYIIYPDTIIGEVKYRIPYIGLPTVWLNDLFSK